MVIFKGLIVAGLVVVTFVLLAGLLNMWRGGTASLSQKLMRWRVTLQFVTILFIMGALYFTAAS